MADCLAAIDQGTTSTRCIVFRTDGTAAAVAQREHRQILPRPGWVEHDPEEIWRAVATVVRNAVEAAREDGGRIVAVGITNQRETTVFWDRRTGRPLMNAIVWQDTRTASLCERLGGAAGPDRFRPRTGLPLASYFSGPKIRWALDNVDGLRDAATSGHLACGTVDSWLIWKLTGGRHATDVTNASRTLLMGLETLDWDDEILDATGITREVLPEITPSVSRDAIGTTEAGGPFADEIPICGVLGDQQAALFGQCCFDPGDAKNTYGTGCFMLLNTGASPVLSRHGLLTTVAMQIDGSTPGYALEGSVAVAGSLVQWFRDELGMIESAGDIESLAASVADVAGVTIVPAFSGLFAPRWRPDARGVITGLTRYVTRAHLARAALEATCFQTRELLDAMIADAGTPLAEMRVDGGMVVNDLLLQMQADLLGIPVVRPRVSETTSLGAAWAAGLGAGVYASTDELRQYWKADRRWTPQIDESERARRHARWCDAVERSLGLAE